MWRMFKKRRGRLTAEIHPDEIFIDSSNLPDFDRDQFEGRLEKPLSSRSFVFAGGAVVLIFLLLLGRAGTLQVLRGAAYAERARNNQLSEETIFADRGIIADRKGVFLAYNERSVQDFAARMYAPMQGLAHVVGYVRLPAKDSSDVYFRSVFEGVDGVEHAFNTELGGVNGIKLTETDVLGKVVSESVVEPPIPGKKITLSIDAAVTQGLYNAIAERAHSSNFQGGAAVIMDIQTGELLALTSYPEFSQNAVTGGDAAVLKEINADKRQPFLDRAVDGLYAPGSIVKPIVAAAALTEGVIDEYKQILSTGALTVPNPYDPKKPTIFRDWRVNGWTDARRAIAVSSDIYFYQVGGGFGDQKGLGIEKLGNYYRMFGFGTDAGLAGFSSKGGNVPSQAWKAKTFPSDPVWRVGNTYHTAIGQYGMQVTPLQAARTAAVFANGGTLLTPTLIASTTPSGTKLPLSAHVLNVSREGMRMSVSEGVAQSVKFDFVHIAAKTGTAQVGVHNEFMNSWLIGFFPYEHPRYAFAVVLERGPAGTLMGAPSAMNTFFLWLKANAPEYLE